MVSESRRLGRCLAVCGVFPAEIEMSNEHRHRIAQIFQLL